MPCPPGAEPRLPLIDIGANLTDPMYQGTYNGKARHEPDYDLVLERAAAAGVERVIVTGGTLEESRRALALAAQSERLACTVGVHPTRCGEFEAGAGPEAHLRALRGVVASGRGKVVAIGECGLDYDRLQFCDRATQLKYFELQFRLAEETGLPMFLHNRNTGGDFARVVREVRRGTGNAPPPPPSPGGLNYKFFVAAPPPPPPRTPPQTKVTIVGNNKICNRENLVGPFLVHKLLGPRPPQECIGGGGGGGAPCPPLPSRAPSLCPETVPLR